MWFREGRGGKWRSKNPCESEREADLDWDKPHPPTLPTSITRSCSKHGCSHQRQPCISEELLRTLQQFASGLSAGARTSSDSSGGTLRWDLRSRDRRPNIVCSVIVTGWAAPDGVRISFDSTNLVSCWCAAYTGRSPSSIKNGCILNNLLHK